MNDLIHYEQPVDNDREGVTIAEDCEHFYDARQMLANTRLFMIPKAATGTWDFGWCFPSMLAVTAAMRVWDPWTQNEPLGWHKRPSYDNVRVAPQAALDPHYNRPRCIHGGYPADGPCSKDRFCVVAAKRRERDAEQDAAALNRLLTVLLATASKGAEGEPGGRAL